MRQTGSVKILHNGDAHEKKKRVVSVTTSWVEVVHMAVLHESQQSSVFTFRKHGYVMSKTSNTAFDARRKARKCGIDFLSLEFSMGADESKNCHLRADWVPFWTFVNEG